MGNTKKKKFAKIGELCMSNIECINKNCIQGKCTRRPTKKKRKEEKSSQTKKTSSNSIPKTISKSIPKPVIKRRLIISSSSSSKKKKKKSTNKTKNKKKKKRLIIIESSSSSRKPIPSFKEEEINLKVKDDSFIVKKDMPPPRLNEIYIELMENLYEIMMKQGEPFRARAYKKAEETIMTYPYDITDPEQLKDKPNIGPTIMDKLVEYKNTGTLKILEREKNNPANKLADVYGIGPKKAKALVDDGIISIELLRENQHKLNDVQKIGLKYYEDILKRIPRSEIDEYANLFEHFFSQVATPDSKFEIVGSYRRGAQNSGDIDVIITSPNSDVFSKLLNLLKENHIIIEILSKGATKSLVICKLPHSDINRRVDFLFTTQEEYPFSVLYFTGSKTFNTVMRGHALKKGYSMNEHGLYKMEGKKKGEKVDHKFSNEKDIFDFLNLEYKAPEERIDGRSVVILKNKPQQTQIIEDIIIHNVPVNIKNEYSEKKEPVKTKNKSIKKNRKNKIIIDPDNTIQKLEIGEEVKNEDKSKNAKIAIIDFKENGIKVLEQLNEHQLENIIIEANKAYYNKKPLMTDNEFDIVKEYIETTYPDNMIIFDVGAPVQRNKVKLPYQMWSMDKIKPDTKALSNWVNKFNGPYVLSCKLDGVSGMYTTEGESPALYTRGNGKIGQDISHLIPYLRLPKTNGIVIRGEFIIPKDVFIKKYKGKFANPRNMVSGIINQKSISDAIKDVHFVAYELIKPEYKPSEQFDFLNNTTAEVVLYTRTNHVSNEQLSAILLDWRENYKYEIDGVIVTDDKIYNRKSGNPEHSFAFKMVISDQVAEAKVVDVLWTPSKDGYLKPRVQIEPVYLGGVKIEYATGFNAAFIMDNKIGIGAVVEIIRSGDVIPKITKIVVPAERPKMPSVPYKWNETHIDIMVEDTITNEIVILKNITGFFRGIGVDGLNSGNVQKLINSGYNTVPKIISMQLDDYLKIDGFKERLSLKIYQGIRDKIKEASIVTLMSASNSFGRGFSEKRIELIMEQFPDILISSLSANEKVSKVAGIKGMAYKSAEHFVEKIPVFLMFMNEADLKYKLYEEINKPKPKYDETHPLYNASIVMTGFRDESILKKIKEFGAKQGSSVSKNTSLVIVKDEYSLDTAKALEAQELGIPVISKQAFIEKYM